MKALIGTAVSAIKAQIFQVILRLLSSANLRQESAAPVIFEKFESYAEPYVRAVPKFLTFALVKTCLMFTFLPAFLLFFSEVLRQIDSVGSLYASAYLVGFFALTAITGLGFILVRAPTLERKTAIELVTEPPLAKETARDTVSAASTMEDPSLPANFSNVEHLRRPTPLSATEVFLNELRAERASFFSARN